jgi:uncharacterized protein YbaP (TraB family)
MNQQMRILGIAVLSLIFMLCSFSTPKSVVNSSENSLLWKIEGNGLKQPSYLFGTMHLIEKPYFYFPDNLEKIVKKSEVVVLEIAGMPDQLDAMKYLVLKEGVFFDYFTKKQTDTIFNWAKKRLLMDSVMFRNTFSKFKPFVVIQTATQMQFLGKTESYELTLQALTSNYKIRLEGLETVAEQMQLFDNLTPIQQAEMVMEGIRDEEKSARMKTQMQELYKRQNIDSLYALIHAEGGVLEAEQNAFLDNRNRNWIPKIIKYAQEGKAFIAVGAGHLAGHNGVIELLRKEGFTVSPVKF